MAAPLTRLTPTSVIPTSSVTATRQQKAKAASAQTGSLAVLILVCSLVGLGLIFALLWLISKHRHRGSTWVRHHCHWLPGIHKELTAEDMEDAPDRAMRRHRRKKHKHHAKKGRPAIGHPQPQPVLPLTQTAFAPTNAAPAPPAAAAGDGASSIGGRADPGFPGGPAGLGDAQMPGMGESDQFPSFGAGGGGPPFDGDGQQMPWMQQLGAPGQMPPSSQAVRPANAMPMPAPPRSGLGGPQADLGDDGGAFADLDVDPAQPPSPAYAAFDPNNPPSPAYSRFPPGIGPGGPASPARATARERVRQLQPATRGARDPAQRSPLGAHPPQMPGGADYPPMEPLPARHR